MSIQPKSTIKPLFVDGATPNGTAFQDWIDSCAFLNTDSSSTLTSLRMPVATIPANAPSGYKTLFFSTANSNNLYAINSSGVISAVAPTQYVSGKLDPGYYPDFSNYLVLLKKAVKIKSVRTYATVSGATSTVDITVLATPLAGVSLVIANTQTITIPATQDALNNLVLTTVDIPANYSIAYIAENYTGSNVNGVVTIEYEEVN